MYISDETTRAEVDRIKDKILKCVIGENCENVFCAITELDDIREWSPKAIIVEQKNPAE